MITIESMGVDPGGRETDPQNLGVEKTSNIKVSACYVHSSDFLTQCYTIAFFIQV